MTKNILVTGASRGIGRAIIDYIEAKTDHHLVVTAQSESGVEALRSSFENNDRITVRQLDLSKHDQIEAWCSSLNEEGFKPDVLINNAGITQDNLSLRMKPSQWQSVIDVNLTGTYYLTQSIMKGMLKRRWGRLIHLSSVVAYTGNAGQANYAASKAGLVGMSKSLALESAARNVTSNVIAPGLIETDMTQSIPENEQAKLLAKIPMKRLGKASEVASFICFLCGDEASYITGQTFHINGGMYVI
ncbi:MAG: 3-oxoacyl-ACP reductase FabG [Candidatus Comchoanobacterales bacterium]